MTLEADFLDPRRYRWTMDVNTRYADLDPNRHVNNVAIAALFEDARARIDWSAPFREGLGGRTAAVVAHDLRYREEVNWPAPLTLCFGVTEIGRSSWTIASLLIQHDSVRATSRAVMVCTLDERSTPLPESCRRILESYLLRSPS